MTRAESIDATRSTIMEAAKWLFAENGYDQVAMREIAKKAEVSTGAIFANWKGKEALYADVVKVCPAVQERALSDALDTLERAVEQACAEVLARHPGLSGVVQLERAA